MNRKNKLLIGVGSIIILVGLYFIYEHMIYVSTDNAQVEAHSVLLASKVPGFVINAPVVEGQRVKKDDILVELDQRDYQNTLRQVKGELASLEARRSDAEKSFRRISSLYSSGAVSQQQYDTSSAAAQDVRSKYESIAAQVAQAQLNLDNTKIKAPSDGFIAKKSVEPGQLASAGIPLIGFVSAEARWITANFKETDIENVKVGNKAYIEIDALSKSDYQGTVESISSATGSTFTLLPPDNATGNFTKVVQRVPVKIKIDGITDKDIEILRAGLSAVVKVKK